MYGLGSLVTNSVTPHEQKANGFMEDESIPLYEIVSIPNPELLRLYDRGITAIDNERRILSGEFGEENSVPVESAMLGFLATHNTAKRVMEISAELYRRSLVEYVKTQETTTDES
jgi:hypothetical protein